MLRVLDNYKPVLLAHVIVTRVVSLLKVAVHNYVGMLVGSQHHADNLLASPEFNGFQNGRGRQVNLLICILKVPTHLHHFIPVKEFILLG